MKFKYISLIFTTLILISGCQSNKTDSLSTISLHPSNLQIVSRALEDIIEIEKIIPLETKAGALLGGIWGFAQSESGIIIRNKGNKNLFIYNLDGSFRTRIDREGKGPGEYVGIFGQDWIPSEKHTGEEIVISDIYGKKLLFFSGEGEFISETKVPWRIHHIASISADKIACHLGRFSQMEQNGNGGYDLIVLNRKGELVEKYFPYPNVVLFELGTAFSQGINGTGKSYFKQLDPTVFQIQSDLSLDTIWRFDFGSYNPDTSQLFLPGMEGRNKLNELQKSDPFLYISDMVQNTNTLLVKFYHKRTSYNNFLNNKTRNLRTMLTDSLSNIGFWNNFPVKAPKWAAGESFIYNISAIGWMEMLENLDKEAKTGFRKTIPGFLKAEMLTENDNPVLVQYKMKDF